MPRAAIDFGSNSLLLKVVADDGTVLHDEARIVGLGSGLGDRGLFQPERMEEGLEVMRSFAERCKRLGVAPAQVQGAATSGARRALNAKTYLDRIADETGLRIPVVGGDEEARLTWVGALSNLDVPDGPVAVADLGGGSTEVCLGHGGSTTARSSLEFGAVRLTETYLGTGRVSPSDLSRLREAVTGALEGLDWPHNPRMLIAVGGTATTLAAISQELTVYDAKAVHGHVLTRAALRNLIDTVLVASPEERRRLAQVSPKRADYLLAGATVLDSLLDATRRGTLTVSTGGIREGLLKSGRGFEDPVDVA